jgi:hypothetical protein
VAIAFPSPRPFERAARTGRIPQPFTAGAVSAFIIALAVYELLASGYLLPLLQPADSIPGYAIIIAVLLLLLPTLVNSLVMSFFARWRYGGNSGIGRYAAGTILGTGVFVAVGILILVGIVILLAPCTGVC